MIVRATASRVTAVASRIVARGRGHSIIGTLIVVGTLIACAVGWCTAAAAQAPGNYPNRPVRVIVPFAVGGPTVVNPSLYATVPYDPIKDFEPVTLAAVTPNLLSVHPSIPARTVSELVALIRANLGKYNYAAPGAGTTSHLSGELFKLSFARDLVHVPFNGSGLAVAAAVPGHTPIVFAALSPQVPQVKDGRLRALAVTSKHRSSALPDVPTLTELGLAHVSETIQGVLVPAATPKPITSFLIARSPTSSARRT